MKLADISKYQGEIDFDKLKIDGLIIRVGYRGYSNGLTVKDKYLDRNIKEAKKHEIPYGLYWYSQAINEKERQQEAQILINEASGHDVLFLRLDMELTGSGIGRADQLTKEQRQNIANTFRDYVNNKGYTAVIYSNESYFKENLDYESDKYLNWVANWTKEPQITYEIWQYTNRGKIPGINTIVDLNKTTWTVEDFTGKDQTYKIFEKIEREMKEISDLITYLKGKML